MSSRITEHFPDHYIDQIREQPESNYFTPVLRETLAYIGAPRDVCDVGCGNGVFSAALKQTATCRLVGIDGSRHALEQAKALGFDDLYLIDDLSADPLPLPSTSFDLVICKDVMEHLLRPRHLADEIGRVVRGRGHALIHVPNHFPVVGRVRLLLRNTIDPFDYFPESERWNFPHIRFFTMRSLVTLMRSASFEVARDFSHHFFVGGAPGRVLPARVKRLICARFPDAWSEGYTVLFKKTG